VEKPRSKEDEDEEEEEGEEEEVMEEQAEKCEGDERERIEAAAAERQQLKAWISTLRHKRIIVRYVHPQPIYVLFNPWNHSTSPHLLT